METMVKGHSAHRGSTLHKQSLVPLNRYEKILLTLVSSEFFSQGPCRRRTPQTGTQLELVPHHPKGEASTVQLTQVSKNGEGNLILQCIGTTPLLHISVSPPDTDPSGLSNVPLVQTVAAYHLFLLQMSALL